MSLTAGEVNELIAKAFDADDYLEKPYRDDEELVDRIPWSEVGDFFDTPVNVEGTVIETIVDERELGQPDSWQVVLTVVQADGTVQYFGFRGYYDSWNGCTWEIEGVEEMDRHERTIVEYY